MASLPVVPLAAVALVLAAFAVLARRHPVLLRMGARNAGRRKAQTLVVVLGLMVGTAIISGSLASGDSLTYGIRKGAYDGLGPADLFVQLEGQFHFPRAVYDDLARDAAVQREVRALSPLLYEEGALSNPETRQSEPRVSVIGFDPRLNGPFGAFHTSDGRVLTGEGLGARDAFLLREVAENLGARQGDALTLHYSEPPTPLVPRAFPLNATLTASAGACALPPDLCGYVAPPGEPATLTFPVEPGARHVTALVGWAEQPGVDLDHLLRGPDGAVVAANANGTAAQPDNPSTLNASAPLAAGEWTYEVRAKAAANVPLRALVLVFYEEYNLTALQEFASQAEQAGFAPEDLLPGGAGDAKLRSETVTVRAIVEPEGFGDFLLGPNVFLRLDTVAELYGQDDRLNLILASGAADPEQGAARSATMAAALAPAVNASADRHPDEPSIAQVKVVHVKEGWLESADRAGALFTEFLTVIGSFTVLAGIMLIINIFVMLAEERKSELGMARAVGLTRRQLVLLFAFEGLLYALAATVLGVLLGLGLAWVLIWGIDTFLASDNPDGLVSFPFHVEPSSIVWAFAAGFLITLVTIGIASWKVSTLNVVRAIRRLDDPPRRATKAAFLAGVALTLVGLAGTAYALLADHYVLKVLAPNALLGGLGLTASRFAPRRIAYTAGSAGVALYSGWSLFELGNPDGLLNRVMGPLRGVLIVLAIVLIVVHVPQIVRLTRALLMRIRSLIPAVTPGVAYPLEKRVRTGLTMVMFALVILVVVAFSVFTATFTIDLQAQSGGYDVEGETTAPIGDLRTWYAGNRGADADADAPDPFARIERYDALRYATVFGGRLLTIEGQEVRYQGPPVDYIYSYDEDFARQNRFELESRDAAYATDEEAYRAVLSDPGLVIVSSIYNFDEAGQPGAHQVGDTLRMESQGGTIEMRIVGFQKQFYLGGIFVAPEVLDTNFQRIRGEYLIDLREGEDPEIAAREIEAAFQEAGMDAVSIEAEAAKLLEQNRRFLTLFQLFLGFGLVVGIASVGIVTARAVIERRQEIGMLRAIGYPARQILRMFYIEIFFVTTLGVLIGTAIGIFVTYGVVASSDQLEALGVEFTVPWLDIAQVVLLTYVAVFLTTFVPVRRAARIPPAEAVRYVE